MSSTFRDPIELMIGSCSQEIRRSCDHRSEGDTSRNRQVAQHYPLRIPSYPVLSPTPPIFQDIPSCEILHSSSAPNTLWLGTRPTRPLRDATISHSTSSTDRAQPSTTGIVAMKLLGLATNSEGNVSRNCSNMAFCPLRQLLQETNLHPVLTHKRPVPSSTPRLLLIFSSFSTLCSLSAPTNGRY